ncbi:MAG TPA: transglycosylase domain-containing protein, partial [Micromonosporaceae bacterium]|nr:transglycosylase domain-containing protein [Micromonosporaceae bacterium]
MITRALRAVASLGPLLRAGLIGGVALAAIAYPLAAVTGLGAKRGAEMVGKLPAELRLEPPAQTTYVYAADGKTLITMFYEEHRKYTPIDQISPYLQRAILAAEDARFYEHHGVDPKGIARAFVANQQAGGVSQGASTLTMQYVRMALRDGARTPAEALAATEQTSGRKLREMRLAVELENRYTKPQILERYLNAAYFGHRAFGVFAAAQVFFSKEPRALTLPEAAMLAGLVKAPSAYDPASNDRRAATARRNWVIDRMVEQHYLPAAAAAAAKRTPIQLRLTNPPNDCVSVPRRANHWGFFCDFFRNWWLAQPAFGANPAERLDELRRGGYRVVTSLDPRIQARAQKHVLDKEGVRSRYAHGTVVVQPRTGRVRAMAVNRVYSLDQSRNGRHSDPRRRGKVRGNYPNTVNPLLGGGNLPGYQAGSTFKMFTMLAALDAGMPLSTSYYAPHRLRSNYFTAWNDPKACGGGHWCPQNASRSMTGRHAMWSGFGKSVNTYFVQLEQAVGAKKAVRMAEKLGLRWRTDIDKLQASPEKADTWGAFTLGVADTTPLEMANAYATVAADGRYCRPLPLTSVTRDDGEQVTYRGVPVAAPRCRQVVEPAVARAAADAARCVTGYGAEGGGCGGWSTAPGVYGTVRRPVAGKTGTTDDTRAAWFVGFTPELAAASFVADPDNPFHEVGDWNSWKPIQSASETLRDALKG